ncbi:unnamed protein product [Amoebophrya sp. A120]|nr:unnamed protein product [Amoebophrya sp. A120]|eukprot:GSA120T00010050001.1
MLLSSSPGPGPLRLTKFGYQSWSSRDEEEAGLNHGTSLRQKKACFSTEEKININQQELLEENFDCACFFRRDGISGKVVNW